MPSSASHRKAPLSSSWVFAYSMTPSDKLTSPYIPAFQSIHASSPWRHDTAPCLGPSLWPNAPPPAVKMTLEWLRFQRMPEGGG